MSQHRIKDALTKNWLTSIGAILIIASVIMPWVSILHPLSILPHLAVWNIFSVMLSAPAGSGLQYVAGTIFLGLIFFFGGIVETFAVSSESGIRVAVWIGFAIMGLMVIAWVASNLPRIVFYDTGYYLGWAGILLAIIGRARPRLVKPSTATPVQTIGMGIHSDKQANFRCDCGELFQTIDKARKHLKGKHDHKIQRIGYEVS